MKKNRRAMKRMLLVVFFSLACLGVAMAHPACHRLSDTLRPAVVQTPDTLLSRSDTTALPDSLVLATPPVDVAAVKKSMPASSPVKPRFVPDPQRALWLSLIFPGAGQIYNRKYWKLPIIYGGFLGCTYALLWNQQMYLDYSQAYLDIMDSDPNTKSYMEMLPPGYDITGREEQFKTVFKNKKNFYRRYRDLSAFCFIGVYILSVIDAYVDAHLSEFDISRDLSMRIGPAVINSSNASRTSSSYGIGCHLNF